MLAEYKRDQSSLRQVSIRLLFPLLICSALACTQKAATGGDSAAATTGSSTPTGAAEASDDLSQASLADGQQVFRFDTFGDEQFWTDTARMHEVVQKSVSPTTALSVGLKVDADAIPADVAAAIKAGKVDLKNPATTVTLLKLNAVVGLKGTKVTADGVAALHKALPGCQIDWDRGVIEPKKSPSDPK